MSMNLEDKIEVLRALIAEHDLHQRKMEEMRRDIDRFLKENTLSEDEESPCGNG